MISEAILRTACKWPLEPLAKHVEFLDHKRIPVTESLRVSGPYPYYGANGIQGTIDRYIFNEPLILLAEDGGNFGDPTRTIAYAVDGPCWVNNHAHVLRPLPSADIRFLCRQLEQYDVSPLVNGATRAKLTKSAAEKILIAVPPTIGEQRRIAAILDKADAIRKKRRDALKLADEFLRSIYLSAVKNAQHVGATTSSLLDIFSITTGKLDSNAAEEDGQYPFFTCAQETSRINSYAFDREALLLAGNNANGDYSIKHYSGKFNAYQRTYVLSLKNERHSYGFFRYAVESKLKELKRMSKGSNTKYLTLGILAEQMLVVPDEEIQQHFALAYEKVEGMKQFFGKHLENTDDLCSSLSIRAFSGQL